MCPMYKALIILGLLRDGPRSGYNLHQAVRAHGELYADLKKGNLYYLLDRLAADGYLDVRVEQGARGPRGERLIYSVTAAGEQRFLDLLRDELRSYDPAHTGVGVAIVFLAQLTPHEAITLLTERLRAVQRRQMAVAAEFDGIPARGPLLAIAADHLLGQIDAEIAWIERSLAALRDLGWGRAAEEYARHVARADADRPVPAAST